MKTLDDVKVGDVVTRWLAGEIAQDLIVTVITPTQIRCGSWKFDKQTGVEIDEDLDSRLIISYIDAWSN